MNRILAIDYGDSKVGLAINDELNIMAIPIITIFYKGNFEKLFNEIQKYVEKYSVNKIVIGKPVNMNGTLGERNDKTNKFIEKLKEKFDIDIDTIDERLTTNYSKRIMNEMNIKSRKKKQIEDTMSAVYILQTYMEKNNN